MGSRWFSGLFLLAVAVVLAGLLYAGYFASSIVQPASSDTSFTTFNITKGEGVRVISQHLYAAGLINSQWNFEVYLWLHRWSSRLQAGTYTFPKNITTRDLASLLAEGKDASAEQTITLIEGWTMVDIAKYLDAEGVVKSSDFVAAVGRLQGATLQSSLADKPTTASLEGYLFPDTYRVYRGASAEDIVQKLVANFDSKFTSDLRAAVAGKKRSVYDAVIMASIIEKEVKDPNDLPIVADIFYRRLQAGMALESDATLIYALGGHRTELTAADLKNPSLYNSYRHTGLPPGPISNPGLAALRAAVFPQTNPYWYFLTTPDGRTIYARTYQEHVHNKQLYLK